MSPDKKEQEALAFQARERTHQGATVSGSPHWRNGTLDLILLQFTTDNLTVQRLLDVVVLATLLKRQPQTMTSSLNIGLL
jgi:hypothetical protein